MSLRSGITTGLLGYSLRKERLGEGLMFREVETFTLDVQVTELSLGQNSIKYIANTISGEFASRSGDINVKAFSVPTDYFSPNDSIRIGRFNVVVENRKPAVLTYSNLAAAYYTGIDQTFVNNYYNELNGFTENYSYEKSENGNLIASHSVSFNLMTGNKALAARIASGLFTTSDVTAAPRAAIGNQIGAYNLLDADSVQEYYTETFDLLKNSYNFSKKVEYPPLSSDTSYAVKKSFTHSIELGDDGMINVSEKGVIKAYKNFTQAQLELNNIKTANVFSRCQSIYSNFIQLTNGTAYIGALIDYPIINETVLNKPALSIDYTVSYTDNPSISASGFMIEKVVDFNLDDSQVLNINHSYNFSHLKKFSTTNVRESDNWTMVSNAMAESSGIVTDYYQKSPFYNVYRPALTRIKNVIANPVRSKNFSITMGYSNEPIYNITINGTTYKKLEYKIVDSKPVDITNEYKIINRPTKSSVINYAYQTEKGEKTIQINAVLPTNGTSMMVTPRNFDNIFYPLYTFAVEKLLSRFQGSQVLALTYFLSDIKCSVNADYGLTMNVNVSYTLKKYVA